MIKKQFWRFTYARYGDVSLLKFDDVAIFRRVGRLFSFKWVKMNGL